MSILTYYFIFCLATGLTTCITIVTQVLEEIYRLDQENVMTKHKFITHVSMFVLFALCAPLVFPITFFNPWHDKFKVGLIKAFIK